MIKENCCSTYRRQNIRKLFYFKLTWSAQRSRWLQYLLTSAQVAFPQPGFSVTITNSIAYFVTYMGGSTQE